MEYGLFIVGNGRKRYLERTISSWEANLTDKPSAKIIFDDSGDSQYREYLTNRFGNDFEIVPVQETNAGQSTTINFIFNYLKNLRIEYFLQIEEDWMLFRPIKISSIISVMQNNKQIVQMRIPRTVWHEASTHSLDMEYGSLLRYYCEVSEYDKKRNWYEFRTKKYFWSNNPSVFHISVCDQEYPSNGIASEYDFGVSLFDQDDGNTFGYWARNVYDAYVSHIGYHEKFLATGILEIS